MSRKYEFTFTFYTLLLFVCLFLGALGISIFSQLTHNEVRGCVILDLQQQQKISGGSSNVSTEIRYLIITDKETFVSKNSFLNWKFNNADIFFHLERGKKYDFKVAGIGKGVLTDYRNILSYQLAE